MYLQRRSTKQTSLQGPNKIPSMNSAEGYRRELTHLSSALSRLRFQLLDVFNEENISERWESTQTAFLPVVASGKLTL